MTQPPLDSRSIWATLAPEMPRISPTSRVERPSRRRSAAALRGRVERAHPLDHLAMSHRPDENLIDGMCEGGWQSSPFDRVMRGTVTSATYSGLTR
jgi:hypothetical protein